MNDLCQLKMHYIQYQVDFHFAPFFREFSPLTVPTYFPSFIFWKQSTHTFEHKNHEEFARNFIIFVSKKYVF